MFNGSVGLFMESIMEKRQIEVNETLALRRWFYDEALMTEADADALLALDAALTSREPQFERLLVEALTDFVVYRQRPTARVTEAQAEWLVARLGGAGGQVATRAGLMLLVRVIEEAAEVPESLRLFALRQIRHAAITGEGPAAAGRVHFSRTVDAGDVELIDRVLRRGPAAALEAGEAEAEILFDIADACTGSNDDAWDALFVEAIAGHVRASGAAGKAASARVEWLNARVHGDGRVSLAEASLLAFVGREADHGAAARAAIVRMA